MAMGHHREVVPSIVGRNRQPQQLSCRVKEDMVGSQVCASSRNENSVDSLESA